MELLLGTYIFICCLYFLLCSSKNTAQVSTKEIVFVTISFAILLYVHCAVDINSVEDLWSYEYTYKEAGKTSWKSLNDVFRTPEYVFNIFNKLVNYFSRDFRFFLVLYNIILFCLYYYTFKKFSVNIPLSIVCMVLIVYFQSIFVIRQHLAIAILLLTIPFIIQQKIVPYLLICTIAFYVHLSSIIWIPIYFLYNMKNKTVYILMLLSVSVILIFIGSSLDKITIFIGADYFSYLDDGASVSIIKKMINVVYLIVYVSVLGKKIFNDGIYKLTTTLLLVSTIGYLFAPSISLIDRTLIYYNINLLFAIPLIWLHLSSSILRLLFILSVFILQGYVSAQPLSEDYYKHFSLESINIVYIIMCILSVLIIYRMYRQRNESNNFSKHKNVLFQYN